MTHEALVVLSAIIFMSARIEGFTALTPSKDEGYEGWKKFNGYFYKVFVQNSTWDEANKFCQEHEANLASIHSREENDFIYGKSRYSKRVELKTPTYEGFLWIGLKKDGDQWKWSDDSQLDYTFWHPEEPNGGENENCAELYNHLFFNGEWNDVPCDRTMRAYICKAKASE